MEWVLAALAAVLVATAAALVLPVRLEGGLAGDGRRTCLRAKASALGGLVRLGRDESGSYWACGRFRRFFKTPVTKAAAGREAEGRGAALRRWAGQAAGERRAVLKLARSLWAATTLNIHGDLRYGCEDPATTAWLHALYCVFRDAGAAAELTAVPDFLNVGWFGHAAVTATVRPIRVAAPVMSFLVGYFVRRIKNKRMGGRRRWLVQT